MDDSTRMSRRVELMKRNEKYLKKQREEYEVTKFVSHESLKLPVYGIDAGETPDFTIKTTKGLYSIELTSIVTPDIKAIEVKQKRIVEGARDMFILKYTEKVRVYVMFNNNPIECSKRDEIKYSKELFEIVEKIYLNNKDFKFRTSYKDRVQPTLHIEDIIISNDTDLDNWQPFGAFLVPQVEHKMIENIIKAKEKGLQKYQSQFKENWLVITSNYGERSSANDFAFFKGYNGETKFDKVYVYSLRENEVITLK